MSTHKIRDDLREQIIELPCIICRKKGVDPAHVVSVGAGGPDRFFNVIPLCREHHDEQHRLGWMPMIYNYPRLKLGLYLLGWRVKEFVGKKRLWHPDLLAEKQEALPLSSA